jgi:hypothetical protein
LGATLAIGIAAAFLLGARAASHTVSPKTWPAVVDVLAAIALVIWAATLLWQPQDSERSKNQVARIKHIAEAPAAAIIATGAALANPGWFTPLALTTVSETDPGVTRHIIEWLAFSVVSLLPLGAAVSVLAIAPDATTLFVQSARSWVARYARAVEGVLVLALAATLFRNGLVTSSHIRLRDIDGSRARCSVVEYLSDREAFMRPSAISASDELGWCCCVGRRETVNS